MGRERGNGHGDPLAGRVKGLDDRYREGRGEVGMKRGSRRLSYADCAKSWLIGREGKRLEKRRDEGGWWW